MGSFSIAHWLILVTPWLFASASVLGPFHGPAIMAAITLPQWLH